jgi:tetratricopeptide (TPR) repeat protein
MPLADQIVTLWSLVRANSADGRRTRRRLGAGAALTMLVSGLLTAIGVGIVVVAFAAVLLSVAVGAAAAARALSAWSPRVRSRGRRIAAAVLRCSVIVLAEARTGLRRVRRSASSIIAWLRLRGPGLAKVCADRASGLRALLATSGEATIARMRERVGRMQSQRPSLAAQPIELQRKALRLNTAGTRSRRNGAHADAVELHRRALEILHRLDDRRAVALTQNNLALALSHSGDDSNAIALFEEAAATLHELGEEEHEGRIIANLGLAHRRHGRHEQSENVLQLALTKLTPASRAYETVEAEVRRAS